MWANIYMWSVQNTEAQKQNNPWKGIKWLSTMMQWKVALAQPLNLNLTGTYWKVAWEQLYTVVLLYIAHTVDFRKYTKSLLQYLAKTKKKIL